MIAARTRSPRLLALGTALSAGLLAACGMLSCILADTYIDIEDDDITNKQAVRISQTMVLSDAANAACDQTLDDTEKDGCPQPGIDPKDALPHFLDPTYSPKSSPQARPYDFCSCGTDEYDSKRLGALTLYVEDRDEEPRTRKPQDDIFAALLLDLDRDDPSPFNSVAYLDYVDGNTPIALAADIDYTPIRRPTITLRELNLGDTDTPLDLCNRAGDEPLAPGFHTLRVLVTDRPWFERAALDGQMITQVGVPDLDAGATFDFVTYVFHCDIKRADDMNTEAYDESHCVTQCKDLSEEGQ